MQINNKRKKSDTKHPANDLFDNDFSSILYESKFDKFKPALKVLIVIIVLMSAVWGVSAYFVGTDKKNDTNKVYTSNTAQLDEDIEAELSQCIAGVSNKNPTPETSDDNFYPKLIANYDAQLDCYDQHPDANGAISRSSVEYARENALNSSGNYKDTYLASGGSSSSRKNTATGCDYSLSESEYLSCTDKYYSSNTGSSSPSTRGSNNATPATPSTPEANAADVAWCSSKKTEVSTLSSNYQSARNAAQANRTAYSNAEATISQKYGGSGMTDGQRQQAVAAERQRLDSEYSGLVATQNDAQAKYNTAQSEYSRRCY